MRLSNMRSIFAITLIASALVIGACKNDTISTESPDVFDIKISGKKMIGEDLTLTFRYDTKASKGGTATIELWDFYDHMRDEHKFKLSEQTGSAAWTFKPSFSGVYKIWFTVANEEDEGTTRERIVIADNPDADPKIKREVPTKFTGFYNMEYQNTKDWPEYEGWNGNVLILTYNDNTARLVSEKDQSKRIRDGVIEGDTLMFRDSAKKTIHKIVYYDKLRLRGEFQSPPGKKRADISIVRN